MMKTKQKPTVKLRVLQAATFLFGCLPLMMIVLSVALHFAIGMNIVTVLLFLPTLMVVQPFAIIGFILGLVLLHHRKKYIGKQPMVYSIIAILSPFILFIIIFHSGYLEYFMSYK